MTIEKRDILKTFRLSYLESTKKFYGNVVVNDGEFEIKMETEFFETPEEALAEMKNLLVKAYLKIEA